ncbi:uncharacterized protein LOC124278867 isoform X2 [Haliotis rubra]|nr:uncharacterized protein LOC124278867 isoform X2 [Haliotis rubra]XP_046570622.1 uncharacterized protein LOC124278867 isoform X2 [Haliotis rubra]
MPFHLGLTEDPQRNMLIIKWKKKLLSRSGNALLYIPLAANDSGICFNITINSKRYKHKNLRLRCTDADILDVTNKRFLLVDEDANPVAVNKPMPDAESFSEPDKTCDCWSVEDPHQRMQDCWSPGWVQLNPVENKSMEVDVVWNPCNTSREIIVMIGPKDSHTTSDEATIPTYKLRDCLHSQKFIIKEPGEYEAWVGALGCESPVYVKSAALLMPYKPNTVPENEVFRATVQPDEGSSPPSIKLVVVLVGAFAFIGSLSLGVACFIKRPRLAPVTDPETEPLTGKPTYTIVKGSEEKVVKTIADTLRQALPGSDNNAITAQDLTQRQPSMNDIQIVVLLQDIHAHTKLGNYGNRTVMLQLDYTRSDMESPLVVHVPETMDHPSFTARNNQSKQSVGLSLSDFLQGMETRCSLTSPEMTGLEEEVKQLSRYRRDEIKNILLISGSDHQFHRNACHELAELLRMVGKTVIDPHDGVGRKGMKEIGPQEWTMKQIHKADLILIVSSDNVYRLVDCYEREEASGTVEGVSICVPLCLKQLSRGNVTGKTALVTFGYGSGYLDRIIDMYPQLSRDMRYCLVESKSGAFQEERDQSHALHLFLCRMSSNQTLVDGACASRHCELFFGNIQQMAAAMVEDSDSLITRHSSMESFN